MSTFKIYEGRMPELREKVAKIARKCKKYGCDFHFEEIGEEYEDIKSPNGTTVSVRYVIVEAEGTAIINDWEFIATIDHTEKGNIFNKAMTSIEIPERYRCSDPFCEHCGTDRLRKNTYIIRNRNTGEFKQIGKSCLRDYTHGMSADGASYLASLHGAFEEEESAPVSFGSGWHEFYLNKEQTLRFCVETVRHFGYIPVSAVNENPGIHMISTKERATDYLLVSIGRANFPRERIDKIREEMRAVNFDAESEEATEMASKALEWISEQEESSDYLHNLKTVASLDHVQFKHIGLLCSLLPAYSKDIKRQEERAMQIATEKSSTYVGHVGDKLTIDVLSCRCVTSWESCYDGYHTQITYIYKIVGKDGNVYTWKTSKNIDEEGAKVITGTVKEHTEFRGVKQTALTRCRVK